MQTKIFESLDRLHELIREPGGVNYNDHASGASVTERQLSVIS